MGWFSQKKQLFVSSTAYNMAGPESDRVNYMRTTVAGAVLSRGNLSLGETLARSYLRGPGMRMRAYGRWAARTGYGSQLGLSTSAFRFTSKIQDWQITPLIPHEPNQTVVLQKAEFGVADYTYWVDRYLLETRPDLINTNYTVNFSEASKTATLTLANGSQISLAMPDFDLNGRYLFVTYTLTSGVVYGEAQAGPEVVLTANQAFPSTTGWETVYYAPTTQSLNLKTVVETVTVYSDGRPAVSTVTQSQTPTSFTSFQGTWQRTQYQGMATAGSRLYSTYESMSQSQFGGAKTTVTTSSSTADLGGGVTSTTTTTTTADVLALTKSYRINTQDVTNKSWEPVKILIYKQGSGNAAMDALFTASAEQGIFFPFIPLRINNVFLSNSYFGDVYPQAKKAIKKAIGANLDSVIAKVADNPSIGDIDFAYTVFGVSLNAEDNASKRYLYEFFQEMMLGQDLTAASYNSWIAEMEQARALMVIWRDWFAAQKISTSDLYGTPEPVQPAYPQIPTYDIEISSANRSNINYNMRITWSGIKEETGSGLKKAGAKPGDLWFEKTGINGFPVYVWPSDGIGDALLVDSYLSEGIKLTWQVTTTSWRSITIYDLRHRNLVYGGKAVEISAYEALDDQSESGFIIPLHEEVFRRLPLTVATQMSSSSTYMVLNSYKIVKEKWYQSDWFKVVVVIVIIIITVITGVYIDPTIIGVFGTAAEAGAALGLTGTAALIAGATANALAAMVISQVVSYGFNAAFGDKLGPVVQLIFMIAMTVAAGYIDTGSLSASFDAVLNVENALKLTLASGNAYAAYTQESAQKLVADAQALLTSYTQEAADLAQRFNDMFKVSVGSVDPMTLTDVAPIGPAEPPEVFLNRTLMTGGDIAEMTIGSLSRYSDITLNTELVV